MKELRFPHFPRRSFIPAPPPFQRFDLRDVAYLLFAHSKAPFRSYQLAEKTNERVRRSYNLDAMRSSPYRDALSAPDARIEIHITSPTLEKEGRDVLLQIPTYENEQ